MYSTISGVIEPVPVHNPSPMYLLSEPCPPKIFNGTQLPVHASPLRAFLIFPVFKRPLVVVTFLFCAHMKYADTSQSAIFVSRPIESLYVSVS